MRRDPLLPPNASPLSHAATLATLRFADLDVPLRDLWNPATCPEALLPWLAWAVSIDNWSPDWPVAVRRDLIRGAIDIQRHKGTAKSVRDVVRSFGGAVGIREWWEKTPAGEPYTFDLVLTVSTPNGEAASAEFVEAIIREVDRTKPVRAHFSFTQGVEAAGRIGLIAVGRVVNYVRLGFEGSTIQPGPLGLKSGTGALALKAGGRLMIRGL